MQDRILKSEKIDWKQIKTLQPDNFKLPEQQEVLKKSLLANGFVSPFCVWQDDAGVIWSIDGVHRIKALTELQEQGQDIPELLTANFIDAENKKEAGEILITVFNSKQNKATEQGVIDLKLNLGIDDLCLDFKDLDLKIDLITDIDAEAEMPELQDGDKEPFQQITFTLADDQANFIQEKISEIKKTDAFNYIETFGNQNSNGNALYTILQEWDRLNK